MHAVPIESQYESIFIFYSILCAFALNIVVQQYYLFPDFVSSKFVWLPASWNVLF